MSRGKVRGAEAHRLASPRIIGRCTIRFAPLFLAALCAACGSPRSEAPDLVLVGGKVFTADESNPWAEAIAIRGDRIVAVGSDDDIEDLAGPDSRRIDLAGRVVVPGINDAHRHFQTLPAEVHQLELTPPAPSWEETREAIRRAVAGLPAGTPIHGVVGVAVMTNPSIDRDFLDELGPDQPLTLATFYGHGEIWNSRATKDYGVAADDAQIVAQMKALNAAMLELGITSMQNMATIPLERYVRLTGEADLPLRIRAIRFPMTTREGRNVEEGRGIEVAAGLEDRITLSGVKWIVDGTRLASATAVQ